MGARTLYQQLSVPGRALGCGRYRTEYTANDRETIDDDRLIIDLYAELGDLVVSDGSEVGRTEITRIAAPGLLADRSPDRPVWRSRVFGEQFSGRSGRDNAHPNYG
jgi:hypothetical protein